MVLLGTKIAVKTPFGNFIFILKHSYWHKRAVLLSTIKRLIRLFCSSDDQCIESINLTDVCDLLVTFL